MIYEIAYKLARSLADDLSPYCEKIEIAGGLRRRKADVHDIELVAMPKIIPQQDLFGNQHADFNLLDDALAYQVESGRLAVGPKAGPRFKQFRLPQGIMLDLFVVLPPAQWGVIFAIRTGPAHYSHWLVSHRARGGALPDHLRVHDGAVWPLYGGAAIDTPTEEDFFDLLNLPVPAPEERTPAWGKGWA